MKRAVQTTLPLRRSDGSPRGEALADRLVALIQRRRRPLEVGQIVQQVLRIKGAPEQLQRRLVGELVESDARLAWRGRDLVGVGDPRHETSALTAATFCVVDLETTGGRPGVSRITEIGAVRVEALRITERFSQLVDPETPIPPAITALTGIDAGMVLGQPRIGEALPAFMAFARDDILVAHNAPFDMRFLNYERHQLGRGHVPQAHLDTLTLARRLLRGVVSRFDLGSLAGWVVTRARPCHRALPDAEATAEIMIALVGLMAERGETTLADALRLSHPTASSNAHKLVLADHLPDAPGVYLMRASDGTLLYVGRAVNVRRRVRAYFGPNGEHGRQIRRVLDRLATIEHEDCGSPFEAAIRECRTIASERPPGNRVGLGQPTRRYIKVTVNEAYPRCYVVRSVSADGARYFGPLRSERAARLALSALHGLVPLRQCHPLCREGRAPTSHGASACAGPCGTTSGAGYAPVVARALEILSAGQKGIAGVAAALAACANGAPPSAEATFALLGMLSDLTTLARRAERRAIVVEPGPPGPGPLAFFTAGGVVVAIVSATDVAAVATALDECAAIDAAAPPPPAALEESAIVHERLTRDTDDASIIWDIQARAREDVLAAVARAAQTLADGQAVIAA